MIYFAPVLSLYIYTYSIIKKKLLSPKSYHDNPTLLSKAIKIYTKKSSYISKGYKVIPGLYMNALSYKKKITYSNEVIQELLMNTFN